jgi:hypothetical protein
MNPMQLIVPIALFLVGGCLLCSGCVTQTKTTNDTVNISPSQSFAKFTVPGTEGPLKISIGGMTGEYPVFINNIYVGVVSAEKPIAMRMLADNYTVKVCCGKICKHENVSVKFGKQQTVDVSEQFKKELGSSEPSARIISYHKNGDQIIIDVEFLNPTTETLAMSADISIGYSYIEKINNQRGGNSAQGQLSVNVNPCDRITQTLDLNLISGSNYIYDAPTITLVRSD